MVLKEGIWVLLCGFAMMTCVLLIAFCVWALVFALVTVDWNAPRVVCPPTELTVK